MIPFQEREGLGYNPEREDQERFHQQLGKIPIRIR